MPTNGWEWLLIGVVVWTISFSGLVIFLACRLSLANERINVWRGEHRHDHADLRAAMLAQAVQRRDERGRFRGTDTP